MSIKITEIKNAVSRNDANTEFDLEINHPEHGWIPYSLKADDPDTTINNDHLITLIGSNFTSLTQEQKDTEKAAEVRLQRDMLLDTEVDPIVSNALRWESLSSTKQNEWKKYRTDLLDVPQQSGFPNDVTFPTKPS